MQVPAPFEYERATSVDHAIGLLERLGDTARLVAGGHSLLPMMKLRLANLEYLIDINDLHGELGYITVEPTQIRIGAMTRHRELLESDELAAAFPIFRDAERVIADPVVRNRGTLGGSLCQADPSEDLSAVCTTLERQLRDPRPRRRAGRDDGGVPPRPVRDGGRRRRDAHRDPHPGPARTDPAPTRRSSAGPATGPWSPAGAAVWMDGDVITDARVGLAAVGPNTTGIPAISEALRGQAPSEELYAAGRRDRRRELQPGHRPARQRRVQAPPGATSSPSGRCAASVARITEGS